MQLVKKMIVLLTLAAATSAIIATPVSGAQATKALPSFAVQRDNPHGQQHFATPQSNFYNISSKALYRFNLCVCPILNTCFIERAAQCRRLLLTMQETDPRSRDGGQHPMPLVV